MSASNVVQDQIEKIQNCNTAIVVISELLYEFQIDTDCNNEIPSHVKSERVKSGLLLAIQTAARSSQEALEWLETELGDGRQSDS
jgi:hypothetical protein